MDKHTLKIYDEELALLDEKIAQMGGLAEHQFDQSVNALERRDLKLAEEVVTSDRAIDLLQREIVEQIISMVARRQPVAVDLRHLIGALQITTELERIGDLAKNIAKRAHDCGRTPPQAVDVRHPQDGRAGAHSAEGGS